MSGLAKSIQLETGDEYLAGLWKKDLRFDLLWRVGVLFCEDETDWRRPTAYRAPSWSWAAIEGPVHLEHKAKSSWPEEPQKFELLEAEVTPAHSDPYGKICGGYLKLRAALVKVTIRNRSQTAKAITSLSSTPTWKDKKIEERYYDVYTLEGEIFARCCLDMPTEHEWGATNLLWLRLSYRDGLLLTSSEKKGEYLRAGLVWVLDKSNCSLGSEDDFENVTLL